MAREISGGVRVSAWGLAAGLAALVACPTSPTAAAVHTISFTGQVTDVYATLGTTEFAIAQPVLGSFTVNTNDTNSNPSTGAYAVSNLSVTIGGDYTLTAPIGFAQVLNDFGGFFDTYAVTFNSGLVGAPVNGNGPGYFDIQLNFPTTALASDAFPLVLPLGQVSTDNSNINFPTDSERLSYQILSIAVPEPTTISLFAAASIAALSRRGRRSS